MPSLTDMKPKTGLGRGLDALIDTSNVRAEGSSSINEIELSKIVANPNQPRRTFDQQTLQELADSIREHGVISPITLRKNEDDTYLIIAGERRCRAAKMAGLTAVPAYIRTAQDEQVMEMSVIENIQREDLNAIEIALAYQRLMEEYGLTQEKMSERLGKKRATVANYLRLLRLPAEVQLGVKERKIDMGHARALLALQSAERQLALYKRIIAEDLSVRKVEQLAAQPENSAATKPVAEKQKSGQVLEAQDRLTKFFGKQVQVKQNDRGKGKIVIDFTNNEELEKIIEKLNL